MKVSNGFEEAIILVKDGVATDTGVDTYPDDECVEIELPEGVDHFSRFADGRGDDLPEIVSTIGLRQFAEEIAPIKVWIDGELMPWGVSSPMGYFGC